MHSMSTLIKYIENSLRLITIERFAMHTFKLVLAISGKVPICLHDERCLLYKSERYIWGGGNLI